MRVAPGGTRAEIATALLVYAGLAASVFVRDGFSIPWHYWQLLSRDVLVETPWTALLDLHSQPPVLNALLAAILAVSRATGLAPETVGGALQFLAGAAGVLAVGLLASRLLSRRVSRAAVLALVVLNPFLYASIAHFTYTPWEMVLLAWTGVFASAWFERPSPGRLAALLAAALLVVHTRTAWHPAWFVGVTALALAPMRSRLEGRGRAVAAVVLAALVLLVAWPAKNLARFGFFGMSSWSGYYSARNVVDSGFVEGFFARSNPDERNPAVLARLGDLVPAEWKDHPAVASLVKSDGSPNWNHASVIPLFAELGRVARGILRERPGLLLERLRMYYLNGIATFEGRNPYTDRLGWDLVTGEERDGAWPRLYEAVTVQRFRGRESATEPRLTTGMAVLYPFLLLAPLAVLWHRRHRFRPAESTVALLVFCGLWITALLLVVDGMEGARGRWAVQPFLFVAFAWAIEAWLDWGAPADAPPPSPG
ncbi:MAG: hypothetical protein ACKPBU_03055 [Alphaproteobacteria bacterium]